MANLQHILMVSYDSIVEDALDIIGLNKVPYINTKEINYNIHTLFVGIP